MKNKQLFGAIAIFIGTSVGAGIFGIPYALAQAGFFTGLMYLLALGVVIVLTSLCYGEVVLRTKGVHQLPGYAEKYLGKWGKKVAVVALVIGVYGALIAYLIEVPNFLYALLGDYLSLPLLAYRLIFFIFVSIAIFIGLGVIVRVEKIMVVLLLIVMAVFFIFGFSEIETTNYFTFNLSKIFLPYGVILFALGASSIIPDMKNILTHQRKSLKKAIIIGATVPMIIYVFFAAIVVGVTGVDTSESAIIGMGQKLGSVILDLGAVFGILAMTTSFLSLGLVLKEVFQYDLKMNKILSWALVLVVPLVVVLLNFLSFIQVLGIVGALVGGTEGIIIISLFYKARKKSERKPEYALKIPNFVIYALGLVFFLGIVYEVYMVTSKLLS